jgi:glycosyltransferase involved in cell wall biosynthesis
MQAQMKKILMFPFTRSKSNHYINHLTVLLSKPYEMTGFDELRKWRIHQWLKYDAYAFNWFEDCGIRPLKDSFFRLCFLTVLHFSGKKIIWTIHNRQPHERSRLAKLFIYLLSRWSSKIHILTPSTVPVMSLSKWEKKIVYVPHGDYFEDYPSSNLNLYDKYQIPKQKKILLFMGMVRPYKNIELLIEAFEQARLAANHWTLLICGMTTTESYRRQIETLANRKNIVLDFSFIEDAYMSAYLRQATFLIAPYNKDSSLNSGTVWMAASYAKSMIVPDIPCVQDLGNDKDVFYVYHYESQEEHLQNLVETLKKMNADVTNNPNLPQILGQKAYSVMEARSWKNNEMKWKDLFDFD